MSSSPPLQNQHDQNDQNDPNDLPLYEVHPPGFKGDLMGDYPPPNNSNSNQVNSNPEQPPTYHPPPPLPARQTSECSGKQQQKFKETKDRCARACRAKPHLFLIFVISVLGFCYHFNLTLKQYWSYKTTSNVLNEEPANYHFQYPASTLCFQDVIPYYQITDRFPDYVESVERIRAEMGRRNDSNFWNDKESEAFVKISGDKPVAGNYLHKYYERKMFRNESILSILDRYTHSRHQECLLDVTPATKYGYKLSQCENVSNIVETINGEYRCFTYFLKFDLKNGSDPEAKLDESNFFTSIFTTSKTFEQRNNKVYYIVQEYDEAKRPHPFEKDMRARFSIHSSNMVPVPEFYPTVALYSFSRFYAIDFHKTTYHLLPRPYETKCFQYDLGNRDAFQSRDDCVTKCVMEEYRRRCKCLPMSGFLYRRNLLTETDFFCSQRNKCQYKNYRENCTAKCDSDCLVEQYSFSNFVNIPFYAHGNLTGVQIMRRPQLETVIRHSADKTAIDLICDFGGLGGLWLGFSVISITTSIIQLMAKPLEKIVVGGRGEESDEEEEEVIPEKKNGDSEKKSKKSISE